MRRRWSVPPLSPPPPPPPPLPPPPPSFYLIYAATHREVRVVACRAHGRFHRHGIQRWYSHRCYAAATGWSTPSSAALAAATASTAKTTRGVLEDLTRGPPRPFLPLETSSDSGGQTCAQTRRCVCWSRSSTTAFVSLTPPGVDDDGHACVVVNYALGSRARSSCFWVLGDLSTSIERIPACLAR